MSRSVDTAFTYAHYYDNSCAYFLVAMETSSCPIVCAGLGRSEGGGISSHLPPRQGRGLDLMSFEECAAVCLANPITLVRIFVAFLEDKEAMSGNCKHSSLSSPSPSPSARAMSTQHTLTPFGREYGLASLFLFPYLWPCMFSSLPQVFQDERVAIIHLRSN